MTVPTPATILHVHVGDDLTGELLADVDAQSTADGLAYYLRSRHLDDNATEQSVAAAVATTLGAPPDRRVPLVWERRHPITGVVEVGLYAHVDGACPAGGCKPPCRPLAPSW